MLLFIVRHNASFFITNGELARFICGAPLGVMRMMGLSSFHVKVHTNALIIWQKN